MRACQSISRRILGIAHAKSVLRMLLQGFPVVEISNAQGVTLGSGATFPARPAAVHPQDRRGGCSRRGSRDRREALSVHARRDNGEPSFPFCDLSKSVGGASPPRFCPSLLENDRAEHEKVLCALRWFMPHRTDRLQSGSGGMRLVRESGLRGGCLLSCHAVSAEPVVHLNDGAVVDRLRRTG